MRPAGLGKRDANEREIIEALEQRGAFVHQCGPAGPLDLVAIALDHEPAFLEVKNPDASPSDREPTMREKHFIQNCRHKGGKAEIVLTPEDAVAVVFGGGDRVGKAQHSV